MSENLKLGHLITSEQQRDAVHIAVVPVEAAQHLEPGQKVNVKDGKAYRAENNSGIGVIDPFLQSKVEAGSKCWLYLYPGSITSLRHEWSHPAFEPAPDDEKTKAEKWLREWLDKSGEDVTYNLLISVCSNGDQYTTKGRDLHLGIGDEAWEKIEIVTGRKYDKAHRDDTYFSCSC